PGKGGAHARPAGVAGHLPDGQEGGVEILAQAGAGERVREPADHGEDRQENAGVPERQAGADRERHYARTHSAPLSTYPAPRTVWSRRRSPDASIFRLR